MISILTHLYRCAQEDQKDCLSREEQRDYLKKCDKEGGLSEFSAFRKGLSMGLKLGAFYASEY